MADGVMTYKVKCFVKSVKWTYQHHTVVEVEADKEYGHSGTWPLKIHDMQHDIGPGSEVEVTMKISPPAQMEIGETG